MWKSLRGMNAYAGHYNSCFCHCFHTGTLALSVPPSLWTHTRCCVVVSPTSSADHLTTVKVSVRVESDIAEWQHVCPPSCLQTQAFLFCSSCFWWFDRWLNVVYVFAADGLMWSLSVNHCFCLSVCTLLQFRVWRSSWAKAWGWASSWDQWWVKLT